ncbi:MAG TPA: TolC family protein [Vicinamibacterales bacterium]|nr:TolC family protein [Vicinamibacterales bacterium]
MRNNWIAALVFALAPSIASAQTAPAPLKLTVDEAVKMALENNVDLAADRLDPRIGDTRVAAATGLFKPTVASSVNRNNQLSPPSSLLFPTSTRNDVVTSNVGLSQRLPWFGTSYSIGWDTSHTQSNSFLNSFNPLLRSGLSLSLSQPLLRDLFTDAARTNVAVSRTNRSIADTRLQESVVRTTASVKAAYWNLVSARTNVGARQASLRLAEELVRVNKAKVDVGQSPPIDLVSAQAEVASNQEQLIVAETGVKQAEDRLRLLIFDGARRDIWSIPLEPTDTPPVGTAAVDVEAAVTNALRDRADLARARKDIENANTALRFAGNQRLPDVRVNASYQASGLGGTEVLRTGGFPGTITGPGQVVSFGTILDQLIRSDYPTWTVGVSVAYPIGQSAEEANQARSQLETRQAEQRMKGAEARAIQQVRDAAWKVEMNARRLETVRAVRELAEQRRDVEQKRFDVGMSTSFLVIQAQRDLAQATQNELAAVLAYDLSLVDLEALQQAGPAGASTGTAAAQANAAAVTSSSSATAARTAAPSSATAGVF